MGLSGCCCLVKYLLILMNFLFWAAGIAALALLGWFVSDPSYLISLTQEGYNSYIALLILVGIATLTLIVAILGCCGALKESQCMLVSFFCFLLIVLVAQIATGVYAFLHREQLPTLIRNHVRNTVQNDYGVIETNTNIFDIFHKQFECCGVEGPRDWQTSKYNNNSRAMNLDVSSKEGFFIIPPSCCKKNITEEVCKQATRFKLGETRFESPAIHVKGCMARLQEEAEHHLLIILAIIVGILCFEIFALLMSLCLCCAVGDREDVYKS